MAAVETAMSMSDRSKARRGAFFGRRKGHALRPRQAELFDTLLPRLAIELAKPAPPDLGLLFPNPVDSIRLEIGFGGGEHMIAQAEQHPRTGFIGVEPFVNGMAKAHWKRRFIQDESVAVIARILRPGGEFRFATDVPDYAAWTLKHLIRSPDFAWTAERADDWRHAWSGFSATRYEGKAKREGRVPCYLIFRRTDDGRWTAG